MQQRRSIRLPTWDYRQAAAYFVTLVTDGRQPLFGHLVDGRVVLSEFGHIATVQMNWLPEQNPQVRLDVWVIVPNHIHAIFWLTNNVAAEESALANGRPRLPAGSLGAVVGGYKSAVARRINDRRGARGAAVWQRNYYEHIVRTEDELRRIREYIESNPARWAEDEENPDVLKCAIQ